MSSSILHTTRAQPLPAWTENTTRVPYWVYQHDTVRRATQEKGISGPTWSYLRLEAEIPGQCDLRTTFLGELPVIVVRGRDEEIYAFENRCALIALDDGSYAEEFSCVCHAWSYDLEGNRKNVARRIDKANPDAVACTDKKIRH